MDDRLEIQQLVGRYARALGRCDGEEYAAVFVTPDGYFASGTAGKVVGRRQLVDLVLGQTHCINGTTIGGRAPANSDRPSTGPVLTIEVSAEGVTGKASLRDHGHYEDVYVKTPEGWRFKSRTHLSAAQEVAGLSPQDYEEIRGLVEGNGERFRDIYVSTPKGPRFKSTGVVLEPSADGIAGRMYLLDDDGRYEDVYTKTAGGWRFKSRIYVKSEQ
jgi:hypothetical protein